MRKEFVLKDILEPLQKRFDYILIDTAPALDVLAMNVFAAADEVLVTCTAQPMAWAGFGDLKDTIDRIKLYRVNENLSIAGILITMLDSRVNISKAVLCTIEESFGDGMMYRAKIPKSVKVDEAAAAHQSIVEYSPNNPVAEAYMSFASEFLKPANKKSTANQEKQGKETGETQKGHRRSADPKETGGMLSGKTG